MAPLDLRAGGTWLGVSGQGVFAAVTNLRDDDPDPARRSRGMVVMEALHEPTAARAAENLKALPEEAYNPFHCLVADREEAFHLVYRDVPRLEELRPGVHVIGNLDAAEEPTPKADRIRSRLLDPEQIDRPSMDRTLEELARVCREHGTGGVADTCVHLPTYGTRSSTLLALGDESTVCRMLYADGSPCENEYEDHSTLLGETLARNCS